MLKAWYFSNTQYFYEHGWRGINIDATPGSMQLFQQLRPQDINIEALIGDKSETINYYIFGEPALNTFDPKRVEYLQCHGYTPKWMVPLPMQPINTILEKVLPENMKIDFITMDIEGAECSVIQSLDFSRFAPTFFRIEELDFVEQNFIEHQTGDLYKLMLSKGYFPVAKTRRTVIYKKKD